jgi:hypothetical protein
MLPARVGSVHPTSPLRKTSSEVVREVLTAAIFRGKRADALEAKIDALHTVLEAGAFQLAVETPRRDARPGTDAS